MSKRVHAAALIPPPSAADNMARPHLLAGRFGTDSVDPQRPSFDKAPGPLSGPGTDPRVDRLVHPGERPFGAACALNRSGLILRVIVWCSDRIERANPDSSMCWRRPSRRIGVVDATARSRTPHPGHTPPGLKRCPPNTGVTRAEHLVKSGIPPRLVRELAAAFGIGRAVYRHPLQSALQ